MKKEIEKRTCPTCKTPFKLIKRCPLCYSYVCSICSINLLCIDCFVISQKTIELNTYFNDKYGVKT